MKTCVCGFSSSLSSLSDGLLVLPPVDGLLFEDEPPVEGLLEELLPLPDDGLLVLPLLDVFDDLLSSFCSLVVVSFFTTTFVVPSSFLTTSVVAYSFSFNSAITLIVNVFSALFFELSSTETVA